MNRDANEELHQRCVEALRKARAILTDDEAHALAYASGIQWKYVTQPERNPKQREICLAEQA